MPDFGFEEQVVATTNPLIERAKEECRGQCTRVTNERRLAAEFDGISWTARRFKCPNTPQV